MADYRTNKAEPLTNVVRAIVKAGGSSDREAELVSTNLVEANLRGHDSHGVGMIPRYVQSVTTGGLAVNAHDSAIALPPIRHGARLSDLHNDVSLVGIIGLPLTLRAYPLV